MLHQCGHQSSTQQCSCGLLCGGGAASFSIFFPASGSKFTDNDAFDGSKSDASSSVDCTLSLGTPSTRLTEHKTLPSPTAHIQPPSCMSSFRWDSLSHPKKHTSMGTGGSIASGGGNTIGSNMAGDPLLLARRCANCDTTSTPLWRNGPRGPKVVTSFPSNLYLQGRETGGGIAVLVDVRGNGGCRAGDRIRIHTTAAAEAVTLGMLRSNGDEEQPFHLDA
ncbi:hypothetical protein BHE74_00018057 [Ensete ventricosum]|nr:hypothetical protein BHE74_00018057 [Ensete ventricosum]RZS05016.1 hypothetical protein BHM03_00035453 [Ensete ventricosum]